MRVLAFIAALVGTLAIGTASEASPRPPRPIAGFHTQKIECIVWDIIGELGCGATERGRYVSMTSSGPAENRANSPTGEPSHGPLLRVGRSWRFERDFRCTRSRTKLTCKNRSAHGWTFDARGRVRLF